MQLADHLLDLVGLVGVGVCVGALVGLDVGALVGVGGGLEILMSKLFVDQLIDDILPPDVR